MLSPLDIRTVPLDKMSIIASAFRHVPNLHPSEGKHDIEKTSIYQHILAFEVVHTSVLINTQKLHDTTVTSFPALMLIPSSEMVRMSPAWTLTAVRLHLFPLHSFRPFPLHLLQLARLQIGDVKAQPENLHV